MKISGLKFCVLMALANVTGDCLKILHESIHAGKWGSAVWFFCCLVGWVMVLLDVYYGEITEKRQ